MKRLVKKGIKDLIVIIRAFKPKYIMIGHNAFYQNSEEGHYECIENVSDLSDEKLMKELISNYDYTEKVANDSVEDMKSISCSVGEVSSGIGFSMSFVNDVNNDMELNDYVDFQLFFVRHGE